MEQDCIWPQRFLTKGQEEEEEYLSCTAPWNNITAGQHGISYCTNNQPRVFAHGAPTRTSLLGRRR